MKENNFYGVGRINHKVLTWTKVAGLEEMLRSAMMESSICIEVKSQIFDILGGDCALSHLHGHGYSITGTIIEDMTSFLVRKQQNNTQVTDS